jgi:hypothetical protein
MNPTSSEDPLKKHVISALEEYRNDPINSNRGYDIIRYVGHGRIGTNACAQDFLDWYPLNPGFIFLRLAKEGKLFYKEKDK